MKNNKHWLKPILLTNFLKLATFTIILFSTIVSADCNFRLSGKSLAVKEQYKNGICPQCNLPLNSYETAGLVLYDCGHLEHEKCTNDKKECITCFELAKTAPSYKAFPKDKEKIIMKENLADLPLYKNDQFNNGNCYVCNTSLVEDEENSTVCASYFCNHIEHTKCMHGYQCKLCNEQASNTQSPGTFSRYIEICKHNSVICEKFISYITVYDSSENLDFDTVAQQQKLNPEYVPPKYKIYKNTDELFMEGLYYICGNEFCTKFMTKTEIDKDNTPCIPILNSLKDNPETFFQDNIELLKYIIVNQFEYKLFLSTVSFEQTDDSKIKFFIDYNKTRYFIYYAKDINNGKTVTECLTKFLCYTRTNTMMYCLENFDLFLADNCKYIYRNMFNRDTDLYISDYNFYQNTITLKTQKHSIFEDAAVYHLPLDKIIDVKNRTVNFDNLRNLLGIKLYGDLIRGNIKCDYSFADNSIGYEWINLVLKFKEKFNALWGQDIPEEKQPKGILDLSHYCI